jgi:acetyl esterase/lipase
MMLSLLVSLSFLPTLDVTHAPHLCVEGRFSASGFETTDARARPSNGIGGQKGSYQFLIPGQPIPAAYIHAPDSTAPLPLVIALPGFLAIGGNDAEASLLRDSLRSIHSGAVVMVFRIPNAQSGYALAADESRIQTLLSEMLIRYNIDQNRIYGFGFSAGGSVIHEIALKTPNFMTSYTSQASKLLPPEIGSAYPENTAYKKPLLIINGESDPFVTVADATAEAARFTASGWASTNIAQLGAFEFKLWPINHAYNQEVL